MGMPRETSRVGKLRRTRLCRRRGGNPPLAGCLRLVICMACTTYRHVCRFLTRCRRFRPSSRCRRRSRSCPTLRGSGSAASRSRSWNSCWHGAPRSRHCTADHGSFRQSPVASRTFSKRHGWVPNTGGVASEAALTAKGICRVWAVDTACANFEEVEWLQARSFPINLEGLIVSDKFRRVAYV
jgi:hypothetical protein